MRRQMPSVRSLLTFEAAAAEGSFTRAAERLSITHSAVSHQIRTLEDWFGKPLFLRHSEGVKATEEGRVLAEACQGAFDRLEESCARLKGISQSSALTVASPGSFMTHWLLPRLEGFEQRYPGITVRLQTKGGLDDLLLGRIDALITNGQSVWPDGIEAQVLTEDSIGPVHSPKFQNRPGEKSNLDQAPLLHSASRPGAWADWAKAAGVKGRFDHGRVLETLSLAVEAAKAGLGIAIAPHLLVEQEIQDGNLVAPYGFAAGTQSYALCVSSARSGRAEIEQFRQWALLEAG